MSANGVVVLMVLAICAGVAGCSRIGSTSVGSEVAAAAPSGVGQRVSKVAVTPRRANLTLGQTISLTVTTSDSAGVRWSLDPNAGSLDTQTSRNGQTVRFTAPSTAGVYAVTATSITDPSQSSSVVVGVTDLGGVYTYHNDLARTGTNAREYGLSPSNVNTDSFGKLFSCFVDGAIYTQPLWAANLTINGHRHNVVFVGTEHDSLYAFDADDSSCVRLWRANAIDSGHGGTGGEIPVAGKLVGRHDGDLAPEIGITGTPVVDPAQGILYVVSKSTDSAGTRFYQRLHAIDIATGAEKSGSPIDITATYPGTGDGSSHVSFNPRTEHQRSALALVNGVVYIAWGSHEDMSPFYGWMIGYTYDGARFTQHSVLNAGPNTREAGIWMGGSAPAADSGNTLYVITGNGGFDAPHTSGPNNDYGNSLLKLTGRLKVMEYFTPTRQDLDNATNMDFGGGAVVLGDLPAGGPISHVAIAGGKDGELFVLNRDCLGGFGDAKALQQITIGDVGDIDQDTPGVMFSTPALWDGNLYVAGARTPLRAFRFDPSTAQFGLASATTVPVGGFGYPGSTASVSSRGNLNGIVWILDVGQYCTPSSPGCGPAVLHAYDATNVTRELWNSSKVSTDRAGYAVKFTVPTIANGKVYIGTRGDNQGARLWPVTSKAGELDVYGMKPN